MLKLSKLYFYHIVVLLSLLFVFVSVISYYGIQTIAIQHLKESLKKEILLIEKFQLDPKKLQKVTIFELSKTSPKTPEIRQAIKQGWGYAQRYCAKLHQEFLYVAKKSGDRIIRLAYPLKDIQKGFMKLWLQFLLLFLGFILIALLASYLLSQKLQKEIDKILSYLQALAQKRYYKTISSEFSLEFAHIAKNLQRLAKKLQKREEKKLKYTKKIKRIAKQRNELISAISHEFKNPIAIINGYAETLLSDENMPKQLQRRFIQKIYNASQKISAMIDRLALAMKFENENLQLHKSSFCLCELAKEVVEFLPSIKKQRVDIECQKEEVYADRQMIEIAIANLLDNALKYSQDMVKIVIKNRKLCIIDRGIGIKEEDLQKITKKFYRVSNSWDNSMGLGLFIVSYILKLHGSELKITSHYKEGSRFCFGLESAE